MITLEQSYEHCRQLNKRNGATYYWSTTVLPRVKRHHVHALYGFCRYADDIVDDPGSGSHADVPTDVRAEALAEFGDRFFADLEAGDSDDIVLKATIHTVRAFRIDPGCIDRFLRSMAMDLTVETYESYDDLLGYMDGSAAVIGEMMLPILEPLDPAAFEPARDLGNAFQLTNFLRDIDEDLDRNRVYVPQEDIRRFDAQSAFETRTATPEFCDLMRFEIDRTRELYRRADPGIELLPGRSGRCVRAARLLYARILDEIEAIDLDVFARRARVPTWQKVTTAGRTLLLG
ncbi:MAG: phytoene/squalene synthase family protein [Acidimicrobiales bacterium]|nr:phytoene/squalene synthase family protein [Acidimicrobiales bacterium]